METARISLNRNQLKYIVIIAMVIDHIAWGFVSLDSIPGFIMHFIGRLTGPMMAFFLVEGYVYTSNKTRYAIRLFIFSLISWIPYNLFDYGKWPVFDFSVITTLFMGYMCIWMWDESDIPEWLKVFIIFLVCMLSVHSDWAFIDILWIFCLYTRRNLFFIF